MRLGVIVTRVAIVAGLLAGCSSDNDPDGAGESPQDQPAADDPRTEEQRAADEAAAATMVLMLADFPAGWESTPPEEENPDDDRFDAELAECLGVDLSVIQGNNPKAESPTFTSPNDEEVTSEVTFTATPEDAIEALAVRRGPEALSCYEDTIGAQIEDAVANPPEGEETPDNLELGDPTINEMSFGAFGDESIAFRVTIPLSADGFNVDLYIDVVNVRVGRVGVTTTFQSVLSPFDTEEAARLTGIVVDRVPAGA